MLFLEEEYFKGKNAVKALTKVTISLYKSLYSAYFHKILLSFRLVGSSAHSLCTFDRWDGLHEVV